MSQYDFGTINPSTKTGTQLASDLNNWRDALNSLHRGSSRPAYAIAGTHWIDDTTTPWYLKIFDGVATDTTIASYNSSTKVYTPVVTDLQITTAKLAANAVTPAKMSRTGTTGQVLTSGGTGADPSYQALPAGYTTEQAQDDAASLFTSGTHSQISFTYDDVNNKVNATIGTVTNATNAGNSDTVDGYHAATFLTAFSNATYLGVILFYPTETQDSNVIRFTRLNGGILDVVTSTSPHAY